MGRGGTRPYQVQGRKVRQNVREFSPCEGRAGRETGDHTGAARSFTADRVVDLGSQRPGLFLRKGARNLSFAS